MNRNIKINEKRITRITVSFLFIAVAAVLILTLSRLHPTAEPEYNDPPTRVTINTDTELKNYAEEYESGRHNPEDVLNFSKDTGSFYDLTSSSFHGIGTSSRPFKGTIEIPSTAVNEFHANVPLFNYITTDVQIVDPGDRTPREISFVRAASDTDSPLFAANVIASESNPAPTPLWIITVEKDTSGNDETAYNFAGVIGTIGDNCKARVEFTHNSTCVVLSDRVTAAVSSADDVGVICGNLGENCELTFKISAAQPFDVISTGGHAGGVVGVMGDGSKLIVADDSDDSADDFTSVCNVKATAAGKYAGGLCGEATNAELVFESDSAPKINLSKTVEGNSGAGGVYGHYICTEGNGTGAGADVRTFELKNIKSDGLTVKGPSGSCSAGGIIGYLESDKSVTVTETGANITDSIFARSVSFGGGKNCGGIIGFYSNSVSTNSLLVSNAEVRITSCSGTTTGGILGRIDEQASYVKVDDIYVNNTGSAYVGGGIVGSMGNIGSFVDVTGTVKIKGRFEGGLVKWQNDGIIRLAGTSDLSESICSVAQLISERKNGLVYALGSGSDSGWTFKRGTSNVDDIGDWGEVLRLSSSENGLAESDFFTVDESAHTVSVAGHVANMGSLKDFIKTALNIQLNVLDNTTRGYLSFSSGSKAGSLLSSSLSITADIDLRKTGIISLTRDNGDLKHVGDGNHTDAYFTGTFDGNGHSITLAIGEAYGMVSGVAKTYSDNGDNNYGTIMGHKYLALFARAKDATIENLTLSSDGFVSVRSNVNGAKYYVGGLVAEALTTKDNTFTIEDVSTKQKISVYHYATNSDLNVGGGIGALKAGSAGTFDIKNSNFNNSITEKRQSNSCNSYIGGSIGYDASTVAHTVKFSTIELGGSYDNRDTPVGSNHFGGVHYGGLLSYVAANNGDISRKIELKNITVGNEVDIKTKVSGSERATGAGAFLGSEWLDVDVTMGTSSFNDGVTIGTNDPGTPSIFVSVDSNSANPGIGALVYKATGHMHVNHVEVVKASVESDATSSFGFIVNDALNGNSSALYLEVVREHYDIANLSFTNSGTSVFDEIAAYSVVNGKNIEENGQAIISIRTAGGTPIIMDGASCNTYQNQTSYGINTVQTNSNTRYYYNLDLIRGRSNTDAEKMLLWSIKVYAHPTVKANYFNDGSYIISGDCDMEGLSYYPVDFSGNLTIPSGTTVKFYNREIENGESGTGDTDGVARSTRATSPKTQHYMMHEGIFRNFSGSLTVNGLTLEGNVSNQHGGNNSGFLICGMLGDQNERTTANINNVVLSGAEIGRVGNEYGPLLINKIGKNVQFTLTGVEQKNYPATGTVAVASSLIGDVGYDTAENINLTFSNIALDSRTSNSPALSSHPYGTDRAIFNRATLLNSFKYLRGSLAVYNYTYSEDWPSAHSVTYGKEVKDSVEYAGKENKYYGDNHFTDPTNANAASEYNFSSGFLPYVHNGGNTYDPSTNKYHEIKVNVKDEGLVNGCGQYNDPYNIESGDALVTAAKIIRGDLVEGMTVRLPSDLGKNNNLMWHDGSSSDETDSDYVYKTVSGSTKFYRVDNNTISKDTVAVREYLAGAYYNILSNIEIEASSNYPGLGSVANWTANSYECKFAFRGVIVGNGNTITNETSEPLIKSSNGCVVKDLTIAVEAAVSIMQVSVKQFNYADESCNTYGAVIGKVMGGDTIIDNVSVDLSGMTITVNASTNEHNRLMPVGGYIGVVVSGGVIFRNMDITSQKTGITASVCSVVTDPGYLYVNPIIGRVISGYVFNETSAYVASSSILVNRVVINGVTTVKNYDICDLNPNNTNKLTVEGEAAGSLSVTVPDSQALYVLSCVVNSGAGSATYNSTSLSNYTSGNSQWSAYRKYTSVKNAQYNDVGTSAVREGDYSSTSEDIKYIATNKVPYIIATYTNKTGNVYHARSICGNGDNAAVNTITLSNTTYNLGAGYRGIGHLFVENNAFRLRFNKISGSNATINLNMVYQEYNHKSGNRDSTNNNYVENYKPLTNFGFGLFNKMYQMNASETNVIENLTLSGSVFYDIRKLSDGSKIKYAYGWHNYQSTTGYYYDVADRLEETTILHTGGLAGSCATAVYTNNVSLNSLSVEGTKYAGGLIGYISSQTVTIISPSATSITVTGGMFAGGLVGGFENENLTIQGSENNPSIINLNSIVVKGAPSVAKLQDTAFSEMFHSAGGLCGSVRTSSDKKMLIANIIVTGGSIVAENRNYLGTKENGEVSTIRSANDLRYKTLTGGMAGRLKDSKAEINNVVIESVDILGDISGGLFGYSSGSLNLEINNSSLNGASGNSNITGSNEAAGVIAYIWTSSLAVNIEGLTVDGWNIVSSESIATRPAAGGYFGICYVTNTVNNFSISASVINSCDLRIASNLDKDSAWGGVGGVFGYLGGTKVVTLKGHNLLINNLTLASGGNKYTPGTIGGKRDPSNSIIKLVGVSIQNGDALSKNPIGSHTSGDIYGTSGYVVMADYSGVSAGNSPNTSNSTLFDSTSDYSATSPYVTVNPGSNVGNGGLFLTGDGVSSTVAGLPIQEIVAEDIRYGVGRANFATLFNNGNNSYISKLSTFNTEQNTDFANDFAVLIVDNVSRAKTTEMINAYINLLANTNRTLTAGKGGYGNDSSSVYNVAIYKMEYDSEQGKFVKSGEANLKRDTANGQFYMDMDSVDTAGTMFSLIDVQYLDPHDSSKVAYHLYVPVLVKKMLTFDFDIAAGSATNFKRDWYETRWGLPVMENIGTPVTAFFRYTYHRTVEEWQAAINNGENLIRNYDKNLLLEKVGNYGDSDLGLPGNTIVVLVDPNRGGKPYYARLSNVYDSTSGVLSLSGFREILDDSNSAAFNPVTLNSLLDLSPVSDAAGLFVNCSNEAEATVTIGQYHYRLADPADENDSNKDHYSIVVNGTNDPDTNALRLEEQYYLSFFTEANPNNILYHYTLSTPSSFGDNSNPSRVIDLEKIQNGGGIVHLILGNIFVQSNAGVITAPNNQEMSTLDRNNTLTVTMTSQIKVLEEIYSQVEGYINGSNISIYHSFIMNMTRTEASGTSKNIVVDVPDKTATYTVASSGSLPTANIQNPDFSIHGSYAEVSPGFAIDDYIANESGSTATITSVITLVYENDVVIGEQFPNREDESQMSIGTIVSGKSNIAYDQDRTSYSKSSAVLADSTGHSYYSHVDNRRAKLTYNVNRDIYGGDYGHLGINPLDSNGLTEITVPTLAVYDISSIADKTAAYDTVRIHITLQRKIDDYSAKLDFPTYMYNIWHEGYDPDPLAANHLLSSDSTNFRLTGSGPDAYIEYVYTFAKADLERKSALPTSLEIPIDYMIYTGAVFEERNLMYSNYKLTLSVELIKSTDPGNVLAVSMADDYIIYTNARVYPDYVNPQ